MRRPSAGYAFPQFMKQRAATRAAPSPPWGSPTPTHITLRQYADWARKSPLWWLPDGRWISGMDHPFVAGPCLLMRVRDRGRSSHCDLLGRLCLSRTITYSQRPGRLTLPALPSGMFKWEGCADPALSARLRRGSSAALRSALRPLTLGARAWDDVEMDHMKRSALTRVSWWRGAPQGTPPADPPPQHSCRDDCAAQSTRFQHQEGVEGARHASAAFTAASGARAGKRELASAALFRSKPG